MPTASPVGASRSPLQPPAPSSAERMPTACPWEPHVRRYSHRPPRARNGCPRLARGSLTFAATATGPLERGTDAHGLPVGASRSPLQPRPPRAPSGCPRLARGSLTFAATATGPTLSANGCPRLARGSLTFAATATGPPRAPTDAHGLPVGASRSPLQPGPPTPSGCPRLARGSLTLAATATGPPRARTDAHGLPVGASRSPLQPPAPSSANGCPRLARGSLTLAATYAAHPAPFLLRGSGGGAAAAPEKMVL